MKTIILCIALLCSLHCFATGADSCCVNNSTYFAKCTGSKYCKVCSNCSSCKYYADGRTCGVCEKERNKLSKAVNLMQQANVNPLPKKEPAVAVMLAAVIIAGSMADYITARILRIAK